MKATTLKSETIRPGKLGNALIEIMSLNHYEYCSVTIFAIPIYD